MLCAGHRTARVPNIYALIAVLLIIEDIVLNKWLNTEPSLNGIKSNVACLDSVFPLKPCCTNFAVTALAISVLLVRVSDFINSCTSRFVILCYNSVLSFVSNNLVKSPKFSCTAVRVNVDSALYTD